MRAFWVTAISAVALVGCDMHRIDRGKELAARDLFDPRSAEFRDIVQSGPYVCGQLNGKNRMGAYVGFTGFVTNTETGETLHEPPGLSELDTIGLSPTDARMTQLKRDTEQLAFANMSAQLCGSIVSVDRTIIDEVRESGTIRGRDWK